MHGVFDYLIGAALIAAPWVFGFANSGAETWVPMIAGAAVIIYSLFTDYELGLVDYFTTQAHFKIDVVLGLLLAVSPWIFGFSKDVWQPHLLVGLILFFTAMATRWLTGEIEVHHHGSPSFGRR
jgi:hypothetical protein